MLAAKPNRLILAWFDWYCRHSLRQHFFKVHLFTEPRQPLDPHPNSPLVLVANHTSFWDGLLLNHILAREFSPRRPAYCMIDQVEVRRHPFLRRVGGFSVNRKSPRDAMRSLQYAANLLSAPATPPPALLIFPQGRILPNDRRPIRFEAGLQRILRLVPAARVVPVALRYEMRAQQRPEAFVRWGPSFDSSRATLPALESQLALMLDRLRDDALAGRDADRILIQGTPSINDWRFPWSRPKREEGATPTSPLHSH